MDHARDTQAEDRERARAARARTARGWARLVYALLVAAFLGAAWQDRALAPPVHDGMRMVADKTLYALENSDKARAWVKGALSRPTGTSMEARHDPITAWLLKWRN